MFENFCEFLRFRFLLFVCFFFLSRINIKFYCGYILFDIVFEYLFLCNLIKVIVFRFMNGIVEMVLKWVMLIKYLKVFFWIKLGCVIVKKLCGSRNKCLYVL